VDTTADPFASAAELSVYSKGRISAGDPRVQGALEGASTAIRRYCGWHVGPEKEGTVVLDGSGGREIALPTKHLTAITRITEHGTLVNEEYYSWSQLGEVRRKYGYWTDDYRAISVTMTHGIKDTADLKRVVLAAVSRELSSPSGATKEQAGQVAVSWSTVAPGVSGGLALLAHELSIIDTYRIVDA
jgi:hypothetical protein